VAREWRIPASPVTDLQTDASNTWRRRLLLARGAQIQATSVEREDRCAIAILDAKGMVIAWHDRLPHAAPRDSRVVNRHMSQFYIAEDIALYLPAHHMFMATRHGVDTQRGWRRRPGGDVFWGVTIIQTIVLSDGEVVGYSHVTRSLRGPAQYLTGLLSVRRPQAPSFAMLA
jgi:hypothetical protein